MRKINSNSCNLGLERVAQISNSAMNPFEKLETRCLPLSAPFHLSRAGCKAAGVGGYNVIKEPSHCNIVLLKKKKKKKAILQITKNTIDE